MPRRPRRRPVRTVRLEQTAKTPLRRGRRRLRRAPELRLRLLLVLLLHGLVAQHAESEVRHGEAAEDEHAGEEHGLVGDGLDEGVEDLGESVRGDLGAGDFHGVLGHDFRPVVAGDVEGGCSR